MKTKLIVIIFCPILFLWSGCDKSKKGNETPSSGPDDPVEEVHEEEITQKNNELIVIYDEDKQYLADFYKLPHLKEFYDYTNNPFTELPALKYPEDLSTLSYDELRLLRNEIYARNGYLFNDGFLRGYFNCYKWYRPIFDVDSFKVVLDNTERELIATITKEEEKRRSQRKTTKLLDTELIVNYKQFEEVDDNIRDDLKKQNFSIVPSGRSMPFFVYDNNAYQHIPNYITTDLYLFILHKYFSSFLEKLDENYMYKNLNGLLSRTFQELDELESAGADDKQKNAIRWAKMYNTLALYAIGNTSVEAPDGYSDIFKKEKENIKNADGYPVFIPNDFVKYDELKPRGHYTKSEVLKKYFRGFKWISLNGIDLKKDDQLRGMIVFSYLIKENKGIYEEFNDFIRTMEKLAGQEDNPSITDIINALPEKDLSSLLSDASVENIRSKIKSLNKERIKKVFGESFVTDEKNIIRVYFVSSTYSVSGEIFSRLVHIDYNRSKRPFPRGLDVPAVFGDKTATNILLKEYRDDSRWPEFKPKLKVLKDQFAGFNEWDHNYGFKGLQTALSASSEDSSYPEFMKTDAYNRKELSTTLASWTHIKHDLILYQEKPFAAEAGQGGGPSPPNHLSYVEPNLLFWDTALELVSWLEELLPMEDTYKYELHSIKELGEELRNIANKEIKGEEITEEEFRQMHWIGGRIEHTLLRLLETDHLPDRERSMALIADVYVYNGVNLNVAVGNADDIYVVVPIKGEYHIACGSVFSYYEFQGRIYNDEEWKMDVESGRAPDRPEWINQIITEANPLKGRMQYRYP